MYMQMTGKKREILIAVLLTIVLLGGLFIVSVYRGVFSQLQGREELLSFKNATASKVLSSVYSLNNVI